jgi:hypothetical protein
MFETTRIHVLDHAFSFFPILYFLFLHPSLRGQIYESHLASIQLLRHVEAGEPRELAPGAASERGYL